ncbi:hypothetical protein [Nannocystis pusilla]|uniref:hypothetical protein n=1 Tax=Nannocystis pusilla TaxID=889268 RepID=UPI003DA5B2EE
MRRCIRLTALALVSACGPGAPGDGPSSETADEATTGAASDSLATGSQGTGGTTTTSGTTIADTAESTDATDPSTATTTVATGSETTTGDLPWGECEEPYLDWEEEHVDCVLDWPTTTMIHGEGPAAGLTPVTRVFFGVGYYACALEGLELREVVLDDPLAPSATFFGGASCGPDGWIGEHVREGELSGSNTPIDVTMTIDGFSGDWMSADPVDPPRLLGTLSGDLVGPFEAVHCAALDRAVSNCA